MWLAIRLHMTTPETWMDHGALEMMVPTLLTPAALDVSKCEFGEVGTLEGTNISRSKSTTLSRDDFPNFLFSIWIRSLDIKT